MKVPRYIYLWILSLFCLLWISGCKNKDSEKHPLRLKQNLSSIPLKKETKVPLEATDKNKKEEVSKPKPKGYWKKYRTHKYDENLTKEQKKEIEQLEAIGYLSGIMKAPNEEGVIFHDPEKAQQGLNLFTSGHRAEAFLMDMEGKIIHQWQSDFWTLLPKYPIERNHVGTQYWRRIYLFENGDILAIYEGLGIIKLDKDSRLLWANPCRAHHDLEVLPNGDIYVLTREAKIIPRRNENKPIQEDFITLLNSQGKEIKRVSLLECVENSDEFGAMMLKSIPNSGDIFHTNSLELLDGRIADREKAFQAGNILTSMWHSNCISVIDLQQEKIVWAKKGNFRRQHYPTILGNGNLLLYDNLGLKKNSRILEFEVSDMNKVWEFQGTEQIPFFSETNGAMQRLPNGNTLITESDQGRVLEVTAQKMLVWEYISPYRAGENDEFIAVLPEMIRLNPDFPVEWID